MTYHGTIDIMHKLQVKESTDKRFIYLFTEIQECQCSKGYMNSVFAAMVLCLLTLGPTPKVGPHWPHAVWKLLVVHSHGVLTYFNFLPPLQAIYCAPPEIIPIHVIPLSRQSYALTRPLTEHLGKLSNSSAKLCFVGPLISRPTCFLLPS